MSVLLSGCDVRVTGQNPPPADRGYEAEVALAVAHNDWYGVPLWDQYPTVVLAFNDQRPDTLPSGQPEWEWFGGDSGLEQVRFRRGASFMGWSWGRSVATPPTGIYSSRLEWHYGGKLRPPPGTSMIYADPSLASYQPYYPYIVYMAYMGTSDARWNLRSGGADEIVVPPQTPAPDQFCVARSGDGGQTFQPPTCTSVVPFDQAQIIDKTSIAVDVEGRAWVAVEVRGVPHPEPGVGATDVIRLYRNRGVNPPDSSTFDEVPIDAEAALGLGNRDPVLRAYPDGQQLSLSSLLEPTLASEPRRLRWLNVMAAEPHSPFGLDLTASECAHVANRPREVDGNIVLGRGASARQIRTGVRAQHAPGYDGDDLVVRFAYEYLNGDLAQVQIVEVRASEEDPFTFECFGPASWTSAYPEATRGSTQAFQPQLSYHMRELRPWMIQPMPDGRGIIPTKGIGAEREWQVAWYGTLLTEGTLAPDVQVVTSTLLPGIENTGVLLPVTEWFDIVCPVPANNYWGDYFGLGQYYDIFSAGWWNVAGYSSSDPAGEPDRDCFQRAGWYASPLHVGASTWPSFQ